MSDEYRAERVLGAPRVTEFPPQHDTPQRRGYHAYAASHPQGHTTHDVASVLGLDPSAVSPTLMAAMLPLLDELERLRVLADQHERRRVYMEHAADRHSVVPCLNRRAFMREVESFLLGGEAVGIVAVLHASGIERLTTINGMAAGEGALRHVAAAIIGAIRTSDMVGCLGGSDFGILLLGGDLGAAAEKLETIRYHVNDPAFTWLGQPVSLDCSTGMVAPGPGDAAEQALAAADRARRGLG